jgi:hypothetical protein
MLTCTQHPTGTLCATRPGNKMRSRYGGGPNVWPQLLADQQHAPPLPMTYTVKHREQSETNHPREQDNGDCLGSGGATDSVCSPLLNGRQRPPLIADTTLEEPTNNRTLDASPDPITSCQRPTTFASPHLLHTLLQKSPLTYTRPLGVPLPLSPNTDKTGQLVAVSSNSPVVHTLNPGGNIIRYAAAPPHNTTLSRNPHPCISQSNSLLGTLQSPTHFPIPHRKKERKKETLTTNRACEGHQNVVRCLDL